MTRWNPTAQLDRDEPVRDGAEDVSSSEGGGNVAAYITRNARG